MWIGRRKRPDRRCRIKHRSTRERSKAKERMRFGPAAKGDERRFRGGSRVAQTAIRIRYVYPERGAAPDAIRTCPVAPATIVGLRRRHIGLTIRRGPPFAADCRVLPPYPTRKRSGYASTAAYDECGALVLTPPESPTYLILMRRTDRSLRRGIGGSLWHLSNHC